MLDGGQAATTKRGSCTIVDANHYFKPRFFLTGTNSITGLSSVTEQGCAILASFFYIDSCHFVYYSNAENTADGYGMCRCMPKNANTITTYPSSAGNNIYSCSSLV